MMMDIYIIWTRKNTSIKIWTKNVHRALVWLTHKMCMQARAEPSSFSNSSKIRLNQYAERAHGERNWQAWRSLIFQEAFGSHRSVAYRSPNEWRSMYDVIIHGIQWAKCMFLPFKKSTKKNINPNTWSKNVHVDEGLASLRKGQGLISTLGTKRFEIWKAHFEQPVCEFISFWTFIVGLQQEKISIP